MPNFGGDDHPRTWIKKCNKFFQLYQVSEAFKVDIVEMYLEGRVDVWYQSFKLVNGRVSWDDLYDSLLKRFGKNGGLDVQEEFNKLVQTRPLMEYLDKFKELKSMILYKNQNLGEGYFVSSFISGLRNELKPMVRLMKPSTLMDAIEIAQYQMQTIEVLVKKHEEKKGGSWKNMSEEKKIEGGKIKEKKPNAS